MGLLSNILRGYRTLTSNGAAVESRNVLEMPDVTWTDDPANNRTVGRIFGSGVSPTVDTLTLSQLIMGSGYNINAGLFEQVMPGTGGSPYTIGQWTVATGKMLTLRSRVSAYAAVTGFGVLYAYVDSRATFINAGAGVQAVSFDLGSGAVLQPPFTNILSTSPSGSNVISTVNPISIPAWAPSTAYVGSLFSYGATNPPTAIMGASTGCSVVSHSSLLYACTSGGTSAGSGGPTGTGTGITDGGATWAYLGPASAGLPYVWTLHELEVLTG